ncbi:MAG: M24 family metallopeptidase [Promethearchaeota archaeon]
MPFNRERAVQLMDKYDADALIATTPENVFYFTGYAGWMTRRYKQWQRRAGSHHTSMQVYAVLPRDEAVTPSLIVPMAGGYYNAQIPGWVRLKDIWTYGGRYPQERPPGVEVTRPEELRFEEILAAESRNSPSAGEALVEVLKERGLEKRRVGLDMENLDPIVGKMLSSKFPQARFGNACELIRLIRMVKTPKEMDCLKRAAAVNEKAIESLVRRIGEGISEKELLQTYRENVVKQGADVDFFIIRAGPRVTGHWPPSDYKIKRGDVILWDVGCIVDQYHSDTGNVAVLGKPAKELLTLYERCNEGIQTALETVAPGVKTSEVADALDEGPAKFGCPHALTGTLHGIGLEIRDYPIDAPVDPKGLSDDFVKPMSTDIPLERDMIINIENPYRKLGVGAVQIEFTLRVTESGCQFLLPQERCLNIVGEERLFVLGSKQL